MSEGLPAGWESVRLDEICISVSQRGPNRERPEFRYIDLGAIDNKAKRIAEAGTVAVSEAPSRAKQLVQAGDVLFSTVRVYLENIAQVPDELDGEIASTAFAVLRPATGIDPRYLYYYVTSRPFVLAVNSKQRGNSPPSVQEGDIRSQTIPLAPAPEQRRIVSKLDEVFSRIDEGEQALERVRRLVERYRQAVLKAAVTGELTRGWREKQGDERAHADQAAEATDLPALPNGWVWSTVGQVASVSGGLTKNQKRSEQGSKRPFLRVANVYANRLDLTDVHEIGVSESELARVLLQAGDMLIVEGNGSIDQIGRVALWDGSIEGCVHQNHLIKARCTKEIPSWWLLVWCMSPPGREHIQRVASSTAGLHTLSISKVQSLPVPIPSREELGLLREIFDRMEALVTVQLAELADEARRARKLRRGVLQEAFAGKLVDQDPNDEPASELLARIASEREGTAVAKRAGRRRQADLPL